MTPADGFVARVTGLTHRYRDILAVDNLDLTIPGGVMAGLIGPDGVGKSSLLALIAGARKIQTGDIEVLGGDMRRTRYRTQVSPRIAYMPEGLGKNLYQPLSAFDNVDFFGRLFGQHRGEREQRIRDLFSSTGLSRFNDRPAGKLSGGMKQKLGLCCSLIHDPDLLIFDEPTTGVDPLSRRQFWELISRMRDLRPGMSVLVATAYMEEAERFDWLAAMDVGKVLATGRPSDLLVQTAQDNLDAAFIQLLPEEKRAGYQIVEVPQRVAAANAAPAIEATGLTMRFGDFTAVDGASFCIERGEIFGFLGSNGCGKTTTMKMLTGLLPPSAGSALLFGRPLDPRDLETRKRVGYMTQAFSLYEELTVDQNLSLHARLFDLSGTQIQQRLPELIERFELAEYQETLAAALPLGIRQRLSLAVAMVHQPEVLILDEPTSGVDPVARDRFWELLLDISRRQGVTIFISTHFMNEAERCDRISLMHAGKVLAEGTPAQIKTAQGTETLEAAFIAHLEDATGRDAVTPIAERVPAPAVRPTRARMAGAVRLFGIARRESLELLYDPIRLLFSLLGTALLMVMLSYGMTFDVEELRFAALDLDQTPASRDYISNIAGSRYFLEQAPLHDHDELDQRMANGELSLAVEIPPNFGRDLKRNRAPQVGVWVDGVMPFRGETALGYVQGLHYDYLSYLSERTRGATVDPIAAEIEVRYRYNQDFESFNAMVPGTIAVLLVFVPAMLTALGVVREKELGSITNLYVTPVTRLEFLVGKQLPYIALSMFSFAALIIMAVFGFGVALKGSLLALTLGALLYVAATTGLGLLMSTFTRSQVAAIFGTAIATTLPAIQFSGLTSPVSSLEGGAAVISQMYPTTYFLVVVRGTFAKALDFADVHDPLAALAVFFPVLLTVSVLLLRRQEK